MTSQGPRRWRFAAGAVVAILLAGCSKPTPLTIDDLRMPASAVFGDLEYQEKSIVRRADDAADLGERDRVVMQSFANQKITGSAYWRYWLPEAQGRGVYKVKVTVYETPDAVAQAWDKRYAPPALHGTEPMDVGDASFLLPGRVAGFRAGRMMAEISAEGTADRVQDFAQAYWRHVSSLDGVSLTASP